MTRGTKTGKDTKGGVFSKYRMTHVFWSNQKRAVIIPLYKTLCPGKLCKRANIGCKEHTKGILGLPKPQKTGYFCCPLFLLCTHRESINILTFLNLESCITADLNEVNLSM